MRTIIGILIIVVVIVFVSWSSNRDEKIMEAAHQYEQCVLDEYETTPASFREVMGYYPPCSIN